MTLTIEIIDPLQSREWDEAVLSFDGYSFFHCRSWARVLADAYGYKPFYLMAYQNGRPAAAWPMFETRSVWTGRKGTLLPFSDHCSPLLSDEAFFNDLFGGTIDIGQKMKWKTIEFRGGGRFFGQYPTVANYNLHVLDLYRNEKEMTKRLRSSTRRNIKKAAKQQIDISISTSFESVKNFYGLNCLTRKHHGLPPQPFSFFKKIHKHILSEDKGIVVTARYQKRIIAGAVFFHFGDTAMYKFGASHRDFLNLRPNNLVMWEAIKWYGCRGYNRFDLGRSEPDNQGLNQFKNGWGATVRQIAYYRYDLVRQAFVESEPGIPSVVHQAFRVMPVPMLRVLGAVAYRHMG